MKNYLIVILTLISFSCNAQIDKSTADYKKGTYILEQIDSQNGEMDYIDYWNLALGTALTEENEAKTFEYLLKCKEKDNSGFYDLTEYLIAYYDNDIKSTKFYQLLGQQFIDLISKSKRELSPNSSQVDPEIPNIVNQVVVNTLTEMIDRDKKYRQDKNFLYNQELQKKQSKLDFINRIELIKLFDKYGYPGKSITGDNEYKNYACLIVEHGQSLTDQKNWLPIIAKAFKNGELNANPLKMLLDRIHWKEYKKQYFGSHVGVPLETKEEIKRIKLKHRIK